MYKSLAKVGANCKQTQAWVGATNQKTQNHVWKNHKGRFKCLLCPEDNFGKNGISTTFNLLNKEGRNHRDLKTDYRNDFFPLFLIFIYPQISVIKQAQHPSHPINQSPNSYIGACISLINKDIFKYKLYN